MGSLASESSLLLIMFTAFFFVGFLLANPILIGASFIPFLIYITGIFLTPLNVQVTRTSFPTHARLREVIEVRIAGKITGGPGAIVFWDQIPEPFELIEGSNFKTVSKGFNEKAFQLFYKIRCAKCGEYWLSEGWEARHILGLTRTRYSVESERRIRRLRVFPKLPKVRRMRLPLRTAPSMHPSGGISKVGPLSTSFQEIRNYFLGDPFKSINWKATARAASRGKLYPLVNEYEREGKLSVWLFLDAHPERRLGTSVENTLEFEIRAAYVISHYFLSKGYSLGMYVYNHRGEAFDFDTGKRQFIQIADCLLRLASAKPDAMQVFLDEGFSNAVERNRKLLLARSPGIVVIGHVTPANLIDLADGVKKMLLYRRRRGHPDILVFNVLPYTLVPDVSSFEAFAVKMLEGASRTASNHLRTFGLSVLDWNPRKVSTESMILNTVRLR